MFADNKTTIVLLHSFSRVTFSFHMRRRPLYYIVNLIIPCCLLSFVAVVTFVLPSSCSERLGLSTYIYLFFYLFEAAKHRTYKSYTYTL